MSNLDQFAPVFERLLEAMVDDASSVNLDANVLPGRVNWSFRVDINDAGKIIGRGGSHLRALQLVVELGGRNAGQEWVGKAVDPFGVAREPKMPTDQPARHDPNLDAALLNDVFEALGVNISVSVGGDVRRGFNFLLRATQQQDHDAMLETLPALYERNQRERDPLSLIMALGTLFRAIGRRQGVRYHIDLET